jgi:sphingomyelin phosphodiesterase
MKPLFTILIFTFSIIVQGQYIQSPFDNIVTQRQRIEDELYNEVNTLLEPEDPDDARKNCDSCLSILKLTKRLCYFPERIQLAVMSNICKRSKLVDSEVVR